VANLILLSLPPALRTQPELICTWFGLSAPVSNLNPFLQVALEDFYDSVSLDWCEEEGATQNSVVFNFNLKICFSPSTSAPDRCV
jgi:hypothetical protein